MFPNFVYMNIYGIKLPYLYHDVCNLLIISWSCFRGSQVILTSKDIQIRKQEADPKEILVGLFVFIIDKDVHIAFFPEFLLREE